MNKQNFLCAVLLAMLTQSAHANPVPMRATITGSGGNGRCTVEVSVDGTAEVEVSGDSGLLTTTGGQPALWRRFQCNTPLPSKPADFRFVRINGRGTVRLLQDPRNTGGRAVIHIDDSKGGRASYTFDLQWRALGGGGWNPGQPPPPSGPWPGQGELPTARAIRMCQSSVTDRLNRRGYQWVNFQQTIPVDNPGRHDWITGTAIGTKAYGTTWFSYSCSVDLSAGRVHSVDVQRR
jgi:hypothetical protein